MSTDHHVSTEVESDLDEDNFDVITFEKSDCKPELGTTAPPSEFGNQWLCKICILMLLGYNVGTGII